MDNKNISELVNNRMKTYEIQGLDLTSAYARVTGELMGIINFSCVGDTNLQSWVNRSVSDSEKELLTTKKVAAGDLNPVA